MLILGIVFIAYVAVTNAIVYGAVAGLLYGPLRLIVPWRVKSRWLLAGCGLAAVAIVCALSGSSIGDRQAFAAREQSESGARYHGTIERPAGIAFSRPYVRALECTEVCQELLFERQVSYVEIVAQEKDGQKTRRYSMVVDHDRCAPVREHLQTTGKVRAEKFGLAAFSHAFEAAIGIDACLAFADAEAPAAPVLILDQPYNTRAVPSPVSIGDHRHERSALPAYAGKQDTRRSEILLLKPDGARDRLLASRENSELRVPVFPPVFMAMPRLTEPGWDFQWTKRLFYSAPPMRDVMNRALSLDLDDKAQMPLTTVPTLIARLSDEPKVRKIAARALVDLIAAYAPGLDGYREGYHVLRLQGEENAAPAFDPQWLEPLLRASRDADAAVRTDVLRVIGAFGPQAQAALPSLLASIDADTGSARAAAIEAARRIGIPEHDVGRMIAALADEDWQTREAARHVLVDIGAPAVAPLIAIVADATHGHRGDAILALSCLGEAAEPAVPLLLKTSSESQDPLRWDAGRALALLRRSEAVTPLIATMTSEPRGHTHSDALAIMGEPAVPALVPLLSHEHSWVRDRAAVALSEMGAEARDALPALRAAHQKLIDSVYAGKEGDYLPRAGYANLIRQIEAAIARGPHNPRRDTWHHQHCSRAS